MDVSATPFSQVSGHLLTSSGDRPQSTVGGSGLSRASREPKRIPGAVIGRVAPNSRFGPSWIRRPDGFFTFRPDGFVAASSPPMLLARHNWEARYIRRLLTGGGRRAVP